MPNLNGVLANAGITLQLLGGGPVKSDSGAAGYSSSGLSLSFSYQGTQQAALANLIQSIPASLRPDLGPLPNPLSFLIANHISGLTLGQGTVSALASAPFGTNAGTTVHRTSRPPTPPARASTSPATGSGAGGDFTTPLPNLPGRRLPTPRDGLGDDRQRGRQRRHPRRGA